MARARMRPRLPAAVVDARRDDLRAVVLRRHDLHDEALLRQPGDRDALDVAPLAGELALAVHVDDHAHDARAARVMEPEREAPRVYTFCRRSPDVRHGARA